MKDKKTTTVKDLFRAWSYLRNLAIQIQDNSKNPYHLSRSLIKEDVLQLSQLLSTCEIGIPVSNEIKKIVQNLNEPTDKQYERYQW